MERGGNATQGFDEREVIVRFVVYRLGGPLATPIVHLLPPPPSSISSRVGTLAPWVFVVQSKRTGGRRVVDGLARTLFLAAGEPSSSLVCFCFVFFLLSFRRLNKGRRNSKKSINTSGA